MPSPFPGMDPYLEIPTLWPDLHHGMISEIRATLNRFLQSRYVVRVDLRRYYSDQDDPGRNLHTYPQMKRSLRSVIAKDVTEPLIVPTLMDEEIEEAFLKIIHVESEDLVTIIEVVSPTNKIRGSKGRASFMAKRHQIMDSEVHWVEIDLLRAGTPTVTDPPLRPSDYRVLISRADKRMRTRFWPISVRQQLPVISIPLRGKDPEASLDLEEVFRNVYDRAAYDMSVDYRKPPHSPLEGDDAKWAKELLRGKR